MILALVVHHVELMVIICTTVYFIVIVGSAEDWAVQLVSTMTFCSIISATICCVICVNIMRIVIMIDDVTSNYIFGIGARLLSGCTDAGTAILFIIMVRITVSSLVSTSNVLIILDQRTLGHVVIIIEALSNILNLSRLKRATLIFLITWAWLLLRCSVEVAGCHSKLFHINLWILFIIIKHLMILTLSQLLLTLETHTRFLHLKLMIVSSGHLLIRIIAIDLLLPW